MQVAPAPLGGRLLFVKAHSLLWACQANGSLHMYCVFVRMLEPLGANEWRANAIRTEHCRLCAD